MLSDMIGKIIYAVVKFNNSKSYTVEPYIESEQKI